MQPRSQAFTRGHSPGHLLLVACRTPQEFSSHLEYALANEPHAMSSDEVNRLTWDAATERFLDVAELTHRDLKPNPLTAAVDNLCWATHNTLTGERNACVPVGGRGSGGLPGLLGMR
jgi:hypothetical protein